MSSEPPLEEDLVSKSQRKREADEMQSLGERLTKLRNAQLDLLPLSDKALDAISEYNRLPNSFGAKRRQLQFIGRIMRDSDFKAISDKLDKITSPSFQSEKSLQKQAIEKGVIKILTLGDEAITEILDIYPQLNRQQLRQMHREYQRANEDKKHAISLKCRDLLRKDKDP